MSNEPSPWSRPTEGDPSTSWGQPVGGWDAQPQPQASEPWRQAPPPQVQPTPNPYQPAPNYGFTPAPAAGSPYAFNPADQGPAPKASIAYILVGVAMVISVILDWFCARAYGRVVDLVGHMPDSTEASNLPEPVRAQMMTVGATAVGQLIPTAVGIAAIVFAIRAMGHPRSRGAGIGALIAALLAPVVSFVIWIAMLMPVVQSLG